MMRCLLLLILLLPFSHKALAEGRQARLYYFSASGDTLATELIEVEENVVTLDGGPNPVFKAFKKKQRLNKRITAAVLAFPFPFGIVGLHRIYLGSKPYVPVAYVASLGGVFGILPFIDFCAITFDGKNFENYRDNGQVFMWLNH